MHVICNFAAAEGQAEQRWRAFSRTLTAEGISFQAEFTQSRGHASALAADFVYGSSGPKRLAVFGGDGTLNEVLQGLMQDDHPVDPDLELLFIPAGSSCDFERSIMVHRDYCKRVLSDDTITIDVGIVHCFKPDGSPTRRYFINNSSIGVISEANRLFSNPGPLTRRIKHLSVDAAAILAGLDTILHFQTLPAVFSSPSKAEEAIHISNLTVFKNPYFGGGMNYAKDPGRASGRFGIAIVEELSRTGLMGLIPRLYMGTVTQRPYVRYYEDIAFSIRTGRPIEIETDGEVAGFGPARYEILPRCLTVVV